MPEAPPRSALLLALSVAIALGACSNARKLDARPPEPTAIATAAARARGVRIADPRGPSGDLSPPAPELKPGMGGMPDDPFGLPPGASASPGSPRPADPPGTHL